LNGQIFGGRVLVVNYVVRVQKTLNQEASNQPSNTVFVGNIPYEITDGDLNKLFGQFENVHEVRMAVDRKTGIPRGFAHVEFIDLNSAQRAYDALKDKEILGRKLRVDYSDKSERQDAFGRRQRMQYIEPEETNENKS
jgi:nucleolin